MRYRGYRFIIFSCLLLGLTTEAFGEGQYSLSGFASWRYDSASRRQNIPLHHVWFIGGKKISDKWNLTTIVALQGPPRILHDLRFQWLKPKPFIEQIVFGRFIPPVGREWADVRLDRLPTVGYSTVSDSLVVRDDGVKIDLKSGRFLLSVAGFLGNRIGGFKEEVENGCPDFYFRPRFLLTKNSQIGWTYRAKHKDHRLWTAEVSRKTKRSLLAWELINYNFGRRWYGLGELQACKLVRSVLRYENLESWQGSGRRHRWIGGLVIYLPKDNALKINNIHDLRGRRVYLVQAILRW